MTARPKPIPQPTKLLSLRQAKTRFRFDDNRDDLNMGPLTTYVFATRSPVLDGMGDVGAFGAPMGVLFGYEAIENENGVRSVRLKENSRILGRLVEVSFDELARLDQVSELVAEQHRFLAEIKSPQTGYTFVAWVYQDLCDMTPVEEAVSALHADIAKYLQPA